MEWRERDRERTKYKGKEEKIKRDKVKNELMEEGIYQNIKE